MTKKTVLIYDSWGILLKNLPDETAGVLIKMIVKYTFDGSTDLSPDDSINAIFQMIKEKLDEDYESYMDEIDRRSEAGKKGMAKRWNNRTITNDNTLITDNNTVITDDNKAYQGITNITDSVSVSDSVSDKDIKDKGNSKRSAFRPPDVSEVRSYCQERKNRVDPERFVDFYTSKGWFVGKTKMKDWKAAVRNWEKEENARSGTTKQSTQPSNTRNDYDFEAIERALVKNG